LPDSSIRFGPGVLRVAIVLGAINTAVGNGIAMGAGNCGDNEILVAPDASTTRIGAMWGMSPGQTFVATDTVLSAITVWRRAIPNPNPSEMRMVVTEVDSTGRPRGDRVLYYGTLFAVAEGDGINPVEIRVDFEPPLLLPGSGKYAFFVQQQCSYFFYLLTCDGGTYPEGELWRTERTDFDACSWPDYINDRFDHSDLCCRIEFCSAPTPVIRPTWGRVKSIYR
jgi:hypothetical protein